MNKHINKYTIFICFVLILFFIFPQSIAKNSTSTLATIIQIIILILFAAHNKYYSLVICLVMIFIRSLDSVVEGVLDDKEKGQVNDLVHDFLKSSANYTDKIKNTIADAIKSKIPAGPTGATGRTGPTGPTGPAGAAGRTGLSGAIGLTGDQGPKGDMGATGPQGQQGTKGEMGPTGSEGKQGDKGEMGPAGPQGKQGDKGEIGPTGPSGTTVAPETTAKVSSPATEPTPIEQYTNYSIY
jgi:hypothetical protein